MFDIFYIGTKPNLFAHEREVSSLEQAQSLSRTRFFWLVNYLLDYSGFDFLWEPVPWEAHQRHAWPSQHQPDSGTYLVPKQGFTDTNFHRETIVSKPHKQNWQIPPGIDQTRFDWSWHPNYSEPPYVYQFGTQWQKTGGPTYIVPSATETKYVDTPRAIKIEPDLCWHVPEGVNTETFDWTWHPDATEDPYIYQFGTQHQRTGGPQYVVPGASDIKFVDQIKLTTAGVATAIVEIDHLDGNVGKIPNVTKTVRYFDNYRDTLLRIAKSLDGQHEFVWVCSSVCDYKDFDFTWHPEVWQSSMLHVFASGNQKFGDTFFIHVPSFAKNISQFQLLEWYNVNFIISKPVPRRPMPVINHTQDSHVDTVKNSNFTAPLALFSVEPHIDQAMITIPLWRKEVKTITPISDGGTAVIVPRAAVGDIRTQLYDYPNIDKTQVMLKSHPLDIVFISNGEPNADQHFGHLNSVTYNLTNRLHRVDGVNGRVAAYHAAAQVSKTPWFFAVFAKLKIDSNFDWSWQPDRMQQAKHYIFHAVNPVNGLVYGHQAMIAYNRALTLANPGVGLDFTLDSPHEVVPIVSGTAYYNHSAWMAWRTAFREVLKLKASLPDVENEYRLERWLSVNPDGQTIVYEDWSRWGAEDAVEFYDSVNGNIDALKHSYEWNWLASYVFVKRGLTTDQ
jgi:hypothetical protein